MLHAAILQHREMKHEDDKSCHEKSLWMQYEKLAKRQDHYGTRVSIHFLEKSQRYIVKQRKLLLA